MGNNLKSHMTRLAMDKLNFATVQNVGIQMIEQLEKLHSIGYLHRDLKPQNILVGEDNRIESQEQLYLIDFGLAINYTKDKKLLREPLTDSEHIQKGYCAADGNQFFSSVNCAKNKQLSRRDDMISLGYLLIYLYSGVPPFYINSEGQSDMNILKKQKLF